MRSLNIEKTKINLSALLREVEQKGKKFIICRNGKPVAELVPYKKKGRLDYDPVLGQIEIKYDPTEDLAEDEWVYWNTVGK